MKSWEKSWITFKWASWASLKVICFHLKNLWKNTWIMAVAYPSTSIFWYNLQESILKKGKDGARQPRTFFALDCYLLGRFSTDLNQIGHRGSCQAGSTPREVRISKFQTVAIEIWSKAASDTFEDGARQPRTLLRTEPGSLGHSEDGAGHLCQIDWMGIPHWTISWDPRSNPIQ